MTMQVDFNPINEFKYNQIHNFGFHFLLLDENNRALHSPFECKDYIQDIFYCEYTKKTAGIYGIRWQPGMLNIDVPTFKVCLMGGGENLESRAEPLKEFLNEFEQAQGFQPSSVYLTDNPEIIVVEFSKEWTDNGPLLSAFNTLIRLAGDYKLGEGAVAYLTRLEATKGHAIKPDYMAKDVANMSLFLKKLAALLKGMKVEHKWSDFTSIQSVHDTGLVFYKEFPTAELE